MSNKKKERIFGHVPGTTVDQLFPDRASLAKSGIHPPTQAGISGAASEGADSIVLSGGYEDDEDYGSEIIYTGSGGRDENTGKQVADQALERKNLALAKSKIEGYPVRVTRSYAHKSPYSPDKGYQYSGLYFVDDYWRERGNAGFFVWRYRLLSYDQQPTARTVNDQSPDYGKAKRKETIVQRVVRDTAVAKNVKRWHKYQCQVCGVALKTSAGLYAEAAHIQPLGEPHNGPDIENNVICLCPNHHVLFDNGGFTIADDLSLIGLDGTLRTMKKHTIGLEFIKYHHEHYQANA